MYSGIDSDEMCVLMIMMAIAKNKMLNMIDINALGEIKTGNNKKEEGKKRRELI